ncbi:hypothetical protein DFH06DRAFT_1367139, partial [Mycena polygramma]
ALRASGGVHSAPDAPSAGSRQYVCPVTHPSCCTSRCMSTPRRKGGPCSTQHPPSLPASRTVLPPAPAPYIRGGGWRGREQLAEARDVPRHRRVKKESGTTGRANSGAAGRRASPEPPPRQSVRCARVVDVSRGPARLEIVIVSRSKHPDPQRASMGRGCCPALLRGSIRLFERQGQRCHDIQQTLRCARRTTPSPSQRGPQGLAEEAFILCALSLGGTEEDAPPLKETSRIEMEVWWRASTSTTNKPQQRERAASS